MADYNTLITETIAQGMNGTLLYNPNYEFINGRMYPRPHVDDWLDVNYEGADLLEARNQMQYLPARQPTANCEFLLQEPENHLCIRAQLPQRDDGVRSRGSVRALADAWETCPLDVSILIRSVGFGPFLDSLTNAPRRRNLLLLSALAQHWWDTTNTFHFSFGEMTITPLDFHMMSGLQFEGQSIFVDRRKVVTAEGMLAALGMEFPLTGGNAIRVEVLRVYVEQWHQTEELTPLQVRQRARCFLLYMLGQSLTTNGGCVVHLWWLHYFRYFTNIEGINWASIGLVALYHSMNMFSRGLYDSHVGMSYLWEVWFLAHFDGTHQWQPLKDEADVRWPLQGLYRSSNRKKGHLSSLENVKVALNGLRVEQVLWFPYPYTDWGGETSRMLSQHRIVFHGEYEYQLYLAERVIRQHSPNFNLQAPIDPPQFMRRPERMEAETITLLHAGVYFEHFLRGPEIAYKQYIARHLMPGSPPVSVEVMRAMAIPGGHAPPSP